MNTGITDGLKPKTRNLTIELPVENGSYRTTTQRYKETSGIGERCGFAYDLQDESSISELLEAERARVLHRDATIQRPDEKIHDI